MAIANNLEWKRLQLEVVLLTNTLKNVAAGFVSYDEAVDYTHAVITSSDKTKLERSEAVKRGI